MRRAVFLAVALALCAGPRAAAAAPEPEIIGAARSGDAARARVLLLGGADPSARGAQGDTALHVAAYRGDAAIVGLLLERGARANLQNDAGATALLYGAGSEEIVRSLLRHGADPNIASKIGMTPLMAAAAHHGSHGAVGLLLKAGADLHARRDGHEYVILQAVYGADQRSLRLLLDRGASPQQTPGPVQSPLATAAYFGDADSTRLLLERGAAINYDSDFAGHALNWALYSGHTDVAELLISSGADLHFKSPWGHQTPPMVFAGYSEQGDPAIARLLLARGADVNESNDAGETALSFALRSGPRTRLAAYLEQSGAKPPASFRSARAQAARRMPARWRREPIFLSSRSEEGQHTGCIRATSDAEMGGNWPRPERLRRKSGHTSFSPSAVDPPQPSGSASSGRIFPRNAIRLSSVNRP